MKKKEPKKRWVDHKGEYVDSPEKVENFLTEYTKLCKKFNLTLAHEDHHGGFIIEPYHKDNIDWVKKANLFFYNDIKEVS